MIFPTIHLNGTSARDLLQKLSDASVAVQDAIRAVRATCPNARDYYPQGDLAITKALEEHSARLASLAAVQTELETLAAHVAR